VLQNEGGADLPISASGAFTFATQMPSGTSYDVTVKSSPTSPPQACQVANGVGAIATADVTNVSVTCEGGHTVDVSGTVSGLQGAGLALQLMEDISCSRGCAPWKTVGPPLQITSNGPFVFDVFLPDRPPGAQYVVTGLFVRVTGQPASPNQLCVIQNASVGTQGAAVTDVEVVCSQFAYVANATDNTVSVYTVDPISGALAVVGTPVATGGTSPHSILGTADKKFVYVGNESSNDISAFAVNPASGALTPVPGSPFAAGTDPKALALWGNALGGTDLYVANAGSDTLSTYTVDTSTGALTPLASATFATGKGPSSIAVDATLSIIYVANEGSNDVSVFSVDLTGLLTPFAGSPFPAGGNPLSLAIGAGGKFLYSANPGHARSTPSTLSGFSIDPSGTLSPLSGSPFPLLVTHYIATDQTGAYLYITSGNGIVGYAINQNTGALTALAGFPVATGVPTDAYAISIDSTNQFLYVTNDPGATVSGFRLDAATGGLTPMSAPFPAGNGPQFIATF
jgi:6-phosphogluconolactonase (cycloisomerase 2 family)